MTVYRPFFLQTAFIFAGIFLSFSRAIGEGAASDPFAPDPNPKEEDIRPPPVPRRLVWLQEIYDVPQAEANRLMDAHPNDDEALRKSIKAGKRTHFVAMTAVAFSSGGRSSVFSGHSLPAASSWEFDESSKQVVARGFERHQLGNLLELEATDEAGICWANAAIRLTRLLGWRRATGSQGKVGPEPGRAMVPIIEESVLRGKQNFEPGKWRFLGTLNRSGVAVTAGDQTPRQRPAAGPPSRLAFARLTPVFMETLTEPSALRESSARVDLFAYSLKLPMAADLLQEDRSDEELFDQIKKAASAGKATLVRRWVATGATTLGLGEWTQLTYGVESESYSGIPQGIFEGPVHVPSVSDPPMEQQTDNAGASITLDFWAEARDLWRINVNFEFKEYHAEVDAYGRMNAKAGSPSHPVFSDQKANFYLPVRSGETVFLATINPPHDTGIPFSTESDDVWLLFGRLTPQDH